MNIFALAQLIVHSTPCRTTIQLCAHVALMVGSLHLIAFRLFTHFFQCMVHMECQGIEKYWNLIDTHLEFIRTASGSLAKKIAKYVGLHPCILPD